MLGRAAGVAVALLVAPASGMEAQAIERQLVFPEARAPLAVAAAAPELPIPDLESLHAADEAETIWKFVAAGAAAGGLAGGTAGYLLYPNLLDPWATRWQWTGITAAEGAVAGAAIGALIGMLRRGR